MTASLGITSPPDQVTTADYGHTDITNVVNISRALIEPLRAAGTGVLINVASMAAYQPNPNMAVYGATKAFVLNFTEALWQESQGTGLRVLALSPGATNRLLRRRGQQRLGRCPDADPEAGRRHRPSALDRRTPPPSVAVGHANRFFLVRAAGLAETGWWRVRPVASET
jgi:NAD(P)-dependent dehydrogenase (short-subunit alcohol dehydrogenase family)